MNIHYSLFFLFLFGIDLHSTARLHFNRFVGKSDVIVYLYGRPHNITHFLHRHPGGAMVLRMVNGKEISGYLAGHKYILGMCHEHNHAYEVLSQFMMYG